MLRKNLAAAVLFSLASTAFAAQPEKPVTPVPVPKEMLLGTRLVLKSAGFSVDIPAPGWSWMTYDKAGQNYLCVNQKTFEIYQVSVGELKNDMTDHHPQSLIASAKKTMEARGGKIEDDKYEFIETPNTKKSAHVSFNEVEKSGKKTFVGIYLVNTIEHVLLKIHGNGANGTEPDAFRVMVKSLKMLDAKPVEKTTK